MASRKLAFAIPGGLDQRTGGTIYDLRVVEALSRQGWDARTISLPGAFPNASAAQIREAISLLRAVPGDETLIVDGLAFGALDTSELARLRRPLIAMVHHPIGLEAGLPPDLARMLIARERANLRHARHVIVPSAHTADMLRRHFDVSADKVTVARPGFDNAAFCGRSAVDPPLILSVGILARRKGHDVLLAALGALTDLDWQSVLAGRAHDPETATELPAMRDAFGLAGRVRIAGEVPDDELARLYGAASIFALATRYEGYGIVFGEAMRSGLPIVSCHVGAVPETVPKEAGLLVPPDDPPAFAAALRLLLEDGPLRQNMAGAAHRHGAALTGWDETARIVAGVVAQMDKS
ncbi:glycosyltransferase family 4 protein [Aureimonas altamirensis]|uniref:glycosyltransferase family 4 protein n=1 Tax=Aureimonas altamirensis TaxID=370622 RepID=UPI001E2DFD88|nr:glycosyltransferase family 4 protein [Aureimonas altamirensis]UHD43928.1 glycosyltransferase family 4 protein [Aureimonas altamirensis]